MVDLSWIELTDACQFIIFTPLLLNLRKCIYISLFEIVCSYLFMCMYICICVCCTAVRGVFSSSMGIYCTWYMNCVWCVVCGVLYMLEI